MTLPTRTERTILSRRQVAGGGLAVFAVGAYAARVRSGSVAGQQGNRAELEPGYARLAADLAASWFTAGVPVTGRQPGILPTNGSGNVETGTTRGIVAYRAGAMWQTAQYARFLANDRLIDPGGPSSRRLAQQWLLLRAVYTPAELGGDGSDGTVNASDDASWKMQYLQSLHEATGDPSILVAMRSGVAAVLERYRDTLGGGGIVAAGALPFSRFGMLYALPGQDPNGQGRSTTYEAGLMMAALYLYHHGAGPAFLDYPRVVYATFRAKLRHASGIYYQSLQLDPQRRHDGTPYLLPIEMYRGLPKQGYTGFSVGGTSAMALLAARLYRATGDADYLRDTIGTVAGMRMLQRQNDCILNDRDPWTNGFYFPDLAREVLGLPGVDHDHAVRAAIISTGRRVLGTRVAVRGSAPGYGYSAEWSGNRLPSVDGKYVTWAEAAAAAANGGHGGAADPCQIMTQANSGMMVQAALLLAPAPERRRPGGSQGAARSG